MIYSDLLPKRSGGVVLNLELRILLAINHAAAASPLLSHLAVFFATYGPEIYAVTLTVLFFALPRHATRARRALIYATLSAGVSVLITMAISVIVFRERPEFAYPLLVHALVKHGNDSSFPSDHATGAFAIATAMFFGGAALGWPYLVVAVLIAVARVAVGVHWPTDVLAGAVIGTAVALLLLRYRSVIEAPVARFIRIFGFDPGEDRPPMRMRRKGA